MWYGNILAIFDKYGNMQYGDIFRNLGDMVMYIISRGNFKKKIWENKFWILIRNIHVAFFYEFNQYILLLGNRVFAISVLLLARKPAKWKHAGKVKLLIYTPYPTTACDLASYLLWA